LTGKKEIYQSDPDFLPCLEAEKAAAEAKQKEEKEKKERERAAARRPAAPPSAQPQGRAEQNPERRGLPIGMSPP